MSDPLSHVASWLKPAAAEADTNETAAIPAPADDARILSLFREWMAAQRVRSVLDADEKFDESDEAKTALDHIDELADAISDTPAAGAAGLAVKAYLLIHAEDYTLRENYAALSGDEYNYAYLKGAILKDVVRFVPELAPLTAAALAPRQPDGQKEGMMTLSPRASASRSAR
jgi:hypothetical protein